MKHEVYEAPDIDFRRTIPAWGHERNEDGAEEDGAPLLEPVARDAPHLANTQRMHFSKSALNLMVTSWIRWERPHLWDKDAIVLVATPTRSISRSGRYVSFKKSWVWNLVVRGQERHTRKGHFVLVELNRQPTRRFRMKIRRIYVIPPNHPFLFDKRGHKRNNIRLFATQKLRKKPHPLMQFCVEDHVYVRQEHYYEGCIPEVILTDRQYKNLIRAEPTVLRVKGLE